MELETSCNTPAKCINPAMVEQGFVEVQKRQEPNKKAGRVPKHQPILPLEETQRLRQWLRLLFHPAIKIRGQTCSFNILNILILILQLTKVTLVTVQMFQFGEDRSSFSGMVNRGHLVLRHLLLKNWDASWETLPYPPSHGDFAVYNVQGMIDGINYAVSQYYNAEYEATGYYVRKDSDNMTIHLKYFDFPGFNDSDNSHGLHIDDLSFPIAHGLHEDTDNSTDEPHYSYDILEEFAYWNITQPFKRLLSATLQFSIHSVRIYAEERRGRCLNVQGKIDFIDDTNNGQILINLETLTSRVECLSVGYTIEDADLQEVSYTLGQGVIAMCSLSLIVTIVMIICSIIAFVKTKQYMKRNYKAFYRPVDETETDLPIGEYIGFFKVWDYIILISDCFTLTATNWILFTNQDSSWIVETLDYYTVILSVGGFGTWVSMLRFFKFHNKFNLLFATLYRAIRDVMAYLLCVLILFLGFVIAGYVVMAPYHAKFKTPAWAAETLMCTVNGDDMFTTINILEVKKTGGSWVYWFSRFYFGAYIAVFTIVVINLLIAIFMNAYEAVREYYSHRPEDRDLAPMERAIKHFLENSKDTTHGESTALRQSLYCIMDDTGPQIAEFTALKAELGKLLKVDQAGKDVYVFRARTLRAFIAEESQNEAYTSRGPCCTCYFYGIPRNDD